MAFDFKKEFKEFYMPKNKPEIVNVPNKRKTNYHIHLIFSERELLPEPIEKIATRNMFYNEHGKHVRTKKEILDDSGNIRKGCKIVKKGEAYERTLFTAKNKLIKQENFLDEAKLFYTDLINLLIVVSTPNIAIVPTVENKEVTEPHKPQIPPKPAMPPDAAVYPKLQRIKNELDKQSEIIFKAEHERNLLEIERDDLHSISRLTKKRELDSKIERKNEEIDILKSGLSGIVKRYGFDTVQQFYNAIKIAQDATYKYQMDVATWKENTTKSNL